MNWANTSQISPKRVVAFFTPNGTYHWGGTETDCRVIQYACHSKTYVCWPSSIMCQCSIWVIINKPVTPIPHPSVSMQTQGGVERWKSASCTCRQAGGQGKKGDKIGWWSQTETARERARESEGHLPHPSGCWGHSLCEGYLSQSGHLKRWGFQEHKNKENARLVAKKKKIQMWVRDQHEAGMRSEFGEEWEGGRVGRLGCRWHVQRNTERGTDPQGMKTGLPKGHSVHQH